MYRIAVVQQKGGSGKTTLAVNFTGDLAERGYRVTLVDADPQGSATLWASPGVLGFPVRKLLVAGNQQRWLREIESIDGEITVIDTQAGFTPTFSAASFTADLILVPCGPSSLDIVSATQTVRRLSALARRWRRGTSLPTVIVPTRVDAGTLEGQHLAAELGELGLPVAPALSHNLVFVRAFATGESVARFDASSQADQELAIMTDFVLERLRRRVIEVEDRVT